MQTILGFWILDFGFWILDFGFWILDFGFWIGKDSPATLVAASDTKSAYADSDLQCPNAIQLHV
jgi:hypothetical protein